MIETPMERADRFFVERLSDIGTPDSRWAREIKRHLADEFEAAMKSGTWEMRETKEAAERTQERCAEIADQHREGFPVAQDIAAAIRALPVEKLAR